LLFSRVRIVECLLSHLGVALLNMMIRERLRVVKAGRIGLSALLLVSLLALMAPLTTASAQTQIVTATPGYVNLGMTTTIAVTVPAAGAYTLLVQKPSGVESSLPFTATSAGQVESAIFGNASSGLGALVDQVGTYNVFVTQGGQTVGTSSFYATNRLVVSMDMVNGGVCTYIGGAARGIKMFPRFYIYYASNGVALTNNTKGISVTFTLPDKTITKANWDSGAKLFVGKLQLTWNYTTLGTWSPTATISDGAGNMANYTYTGAPFSLTPAALATALQLTDAKTGLPIAAIASGEAVNIHATITYPTNAEPVPGFVAPLDTAARGGSATAILGWGYWNATTNTFGGGAKHPGAAISTVTLTYSGANGTWTGQFTAATLPAIPSNATYAVAITSTDKASPPNTGLLVVSLATATAPPGVATTTTVTSTSISSAISTAVSTATTTVSQVVQSIPTTVYAGLVIILVLGLVIGMVVRMPRK
jgi:hypothetical protein